MYETYFGILMLHFSFFLRQKPFRTTHSMMSSIMCVFLQLNIIMCTSLSLLLRRLGGDGVTSFYTAAAACCIFSCDNTTYLVIR